MTARGERSRLRGPDLLRVGAVGLGMRPLRAALSALGIAIGVAAMVSVVGVSSSSRADLLSQLDGLGTNLLIAKAGQGFFGEAGELDANAVPMVRRIGPVLDVSSTGTVSASAYRSDRIPDGDTAGLAVRTADHALLDTVSGRLRSGAWLDRYDGLPVVALGSVAASRLGIAGPVLDGHQVQVLVGGRWFAVAAVLDPVVLAPELDRSVLVGEATAAALLGWDGVPGTVYVRAHQDAVLQVRDVLARTADPAHPEQVEVSRPSDALVARAAADKTFTALLLGLGAVALVVGAVGIANVMVVAVLERRSEIGLRRALGATRAHIGGQFLVEAVLLAGLGGAAGASLGAAIAGGYARSQGWPPTIPAAALGGAVALALATGIVAGAYPALRAARSSPADALRS